MLRQEKYDYYEKLFRMLLGYNIFFVEGASVAYEEERDAIESGCGNCQSFMLHLNYDNWDTRFFSKYGHALGDSERRALKAYNEELEKPVWYNEFKNETDILSPLLYQRDGFTDKKWAAIQAKQFMLGNNVLDIGCNAGWFGKYALKDGADSYTGIDNQWKEVLEASANVSGDIYLDNARLIDTYKSKWDVVICASMLHYITDKEKLISRIASVTNDVFILEVPVNLAHGKVEEHKPGKEYKIPSMSLVMSWLTEYFKKAEVVGESVSPDDSHRLVFHAFK
jgi:SAM-dependent methyltransferase